MRFTTTINGLKAGGMPSNKLGTQQYYYYYYHYYHHCSGEWKKNNDNNGKIYKLHNELGLKLHNERGAMKEEQ